MDKLIERDPTKDLFDCLDEVLALINGYEGDWCINMRPWMYREVKRHNDRWAEMSWWRKFVLGHFGKYLPYFIVNWLWWG